jgi:hypothetical protein
VSIKDADADFNEAWLQTLVGKKIRITGKVNVERGISTRGPQIVLTSRSQVSVVE